MIYDLFDTSPTKRMVCACDKIPVSQCPTLTNVETLICIKVLKTWII